MSAHHNILFMGRIFEVPWGGVREMADSLLRAAAPICAQQGRTIQVLLPRHGLLPGKHDNLKEVVLPKLSWNRILWDHWTVANYANRQRDAVLYNIKLVLPERLRIPGFTTIHDLMYFPQPDKYHWREYLWGDSMYMRLMVRRTVRRAPLTHVVSDHTARDAADLFHEVEPERFRTIHHGIDTDRWSFMWTPDDEKLWEGLRQRGLAERYVFYSGGMSRRKNLPVLAHAFRMFQRRHPEYQLVLTGGAKPTTADPRLRRALYMIPKGKLLRLGTVTDRELALLYQRAAFFVFPSLYEGFGMPPLEAQAAGCPVVCSNATALPEVVGDSALTFDPHDPKELLAHMERLSIQSERRRLFEAGRKNAERFSWEQTARQWLDLADEVGDKG